MLETGLIQWGPAPFRFENVWLDHSSFQTHIEGWWPGEVRHGGSGFKLMRKLWKVRKELKTWNKEVFGSTQTRKDVLSARIKQLDDIEGGPNWNDIFLADRRRANDEYANVLLIENRVASQKLRVKWVKEGDANTKFFHRILGARKSKNVIDGIQLQGGEFTEESSRIEQEIVDYYRHLYTNEMDSTWEINGINWGCHYGRGGESYGEIILRRRGMGGGYFLRNG
ncbi:hypothetical protein Syun_002014 [Stephania yunnanensis]|uniref:Uncharacterized protein n=1 Tax=Stephania yunnanensis TaxID=152371 RepID=A0AAP0LIZ8_9MAGN